MQSFSFHSLDRVSSRDPHTSPRRIPGAQAYPSRSLIADLERATPKAKIIQGRTYCGAEFESKTNKSGLRSAQDRGIALLDNAAVQHGRIHPDVCGVVLRGGL